jgi:SAM-dependent methyltransferase
VAGINVDNTLIFIVLYVKFVVRLSFSLLGKERFMPRWSSYFSRVGDSPNSSIVDLLENYTIKRGIALDLGAGNLRDAKYLLSQGFQKVVAFDVCEQSKEYVVPGIDLQITPIQSFDLEPNTVDFALSCNTLFYLKNEEITSLFRKVYKSLTQGGFFTCNLLAPQDGWVIDGRRDVYPMKEEQVMQLCETFAGYQICEIRRRSIATEGKPKVWHQWGVIVKK